MNTQEMAWVDFLDNLVHHSQGPSTNPWPQCSFDEDFLIVAEFSELEGPRTVLTIPESGGGSFNKSAFAVRIMSVDCTSWQSTTAMASGKDVGFTISGDTQVVMSEPSEGAFAYVHHFTLYDIHARGFVRPFCIAYVSSMYSRIMNNFNSLLHSFSKVASSFRFGNAMSFLKDLKLRHDFLENLKRMKMHNASGNRSNSNFFEKHAKEIENINVEECLADTRKLQAVFISHLKSPLFKEQRQRYGREVENFLNQHADILLHAEDISPAEASNVIPREHVSHLDEVETVEAELASESLASESPEESFYHLSPHSVGITGGRKFDIYLRSIEELCAPVGKDALFLAENVYFIYRSCTGELNADEESLLEGDEKESEEIILDTRPVEADVVRAGQRVVEESTGSSCGPKTCFRRSFSLPRDFGVEPKEHRRNHSSSLQQWDPMFVLFDDEWSLKSSDSYEIIRHSHSSEDEMVSTSSSNARNSPKMAFPGKVEKVTSIDSDGKEPYPHLSLVSPPPGNPPKPVSAAKKLTYEPMGEAMTTRSAPLERYLSGSSQSSIENVSSVDRVVGGSCGAWARFESEPSGLCMQEKARFIIRQVSTETISSSEPSLPVRRSAFRKFSSVLGPDSGYYFPDTSNFSLYKMRQLYSFLPHIIFSLLVGRPVVVHADKSNEGKVRCLIKALLPFIPGLHERHNGVIFWTKRPLQISMLQSMKLIGLCKGSNRILISVKHYISIFDFEACRLYAPRYDGDFLNNIFDASKEWPSEDAFVEHLKVVQKELTAYCFVNFSLMFLEEDQYISKDSTNQPSGLSYAQSSWSRSLMKNHEEFFEGKLSESDKLIVQHLTEVVKEQLVRTLTGRDKAIPGACIYSEQFESIGRMPAPPCIRLNNLRCQVFKTSIGKRKER